MKYSAETTKEGYVETLEIGGVEYRKEWTRNFDGASCKDKEFFEQLEENGVTNARVLDMVFENIDDNFFASRFDDVYTHCWDLIGEQYEKIDK